MTGETELSVYKVFSTVNVPSCPLVIEPVTFQPFMYCQYVVYTLDCYNRVRDEFEYAYEEYRKAVSLEE